MRQIYTLSVVRLYTKYFIKVESDGYPKWTESLWAATHFDSYAEAQNAIGTLTESPKHHAYSIDKWFMHDEDVNPLFPNVDEL